MPPHRTGLAFCATTLLLLLAPASAPAAVPVGSFEFALFLGHAVWLASPEDEDPFCAGFAEGFGGELQACDFSMFVDAKGKITGSVEIQAANGDGSVGLAGPVKGKLKGDSKTGLTGLSFSTKLSGFVSPTFVMNSSFGNATPLALPLPGSNATSVSGSAAFGGKIDGDGVLTGSWSDSFCTKAGGCVSETETPSPETLEGGGWTLFLAIEDLGKSKLGGSASAELGDGTQCAYAISGKYSSKTDVASLKLTPTNAACAGTSISLKNVQLSSVLTAQMNYRLFGQQGDAFISSVDR